MNIFIYVLLLDINCQHLGNICHLEGFCAPFECRVGELPLGKFLGRHVPRWTSSQVDKFPGQQILQKIISPCTSSKKDKFPMAGELSGGNLSRGNLSASHKK